MFAWWPRGSWRKALAMKRDAAPIRRLRDLHELFGLWSMVLLSVMVATGVLLALPAVTQIVFAPAAAPAPTSVGNGRRQITILQALRAAQKALPTVASSSWMPPHVRVRSGCAFKFPAIPTGAFRAATSSSTSSQAGYWRSMMFGAAARGRPRQVGYVRCTTERSVAS